MNSVVIYILNIIIRMKDNVIDRILAGSFSGVILSEEEKCLLEEWRREIECRNRFEGELHELRKLGVGLK